MTGDGKTILVTGSNGQLGKEIHKLSVLYPHHNFLFENKVSLSIDSEKAIKKYFSEKQIDYCINCAAYTAVDKAESEKELAFNINGTGAGMLATICKNHKAQFIHISTDYVFNGSAVMPYKEDSKIDPINTYGASKLRGEELVLNNNSNAMIFRTSWVFSSFGNNFVKTMIRLMNEKESINVVSDQTGCPTYAADLAEVILKICEKEQVKPGIYNYCNEGETNWFEFASSIKNILKNPCVIHAIPTSQFPTPAKRPAYSVLDTSKIKSAYNIKIPKWQNALQRCLSILTHQLVKEGT